MGKKKKIAAILNTSPKSVMQFIVDHSQDSGA